MNVKESRLIGKEATIKVGMYAGEWGVIKLYDGEYYHIALWNGNECLIFTRDEFKVKKER